MSTKSKARLLVRILESNQESKLEGFDEDKDKIVSALKSFPVRTYNSLNKKYKFDYSLLEKLCADRFSSYSSFVIFGCPTSTDIDVLVVVDK